MRIKTLYVKILLSFLGILVITEFLILVLFVLTAGRSYKKHIDRQSVAELMILKENVQEKISRSPDLPVARNAELQQFLTTLSHLFDVKIWMTNYEGHVLFQTAEPPPESSLDLDVRHRIVREDIRLYHLSRRHLSYYAVIKIESQGASNLLHLYMDKDRERKSEAIFLIGLLIIGAVIAILIVPLARRITSRIKRLNQAALDFANGNLRERIDVSGYDEIAKLGKTFNFMADKIEKMIQGNKELTANISHELKSPLARIRVSKELIAERIETIMETACDESLKTGIQRYIEHIDQDIDKLDALIDQVLKLSKMDYQETIDSVQDMDVGNFIQNLEKKYAPLADQKKIRIDNDIRPGIRVKADPANLEVIFSNLIDNAIKYTKENGTIMIKADFKSGRKLLFSIFNSYRKLSHEELKTIFDPFVRLEKRSPESGSGLGLTIVKKMVHKCGATIHAMNTKSGLAFELEFPIQ